MTYKSALANLHLGGGKAVIIGDPAQDKTDALLHAMGDFIQGLGGRYITAEDSGTSVADMLKIGDKTSFVSGIDKVSAHGGDPSPSTAYGVFVSLREAVYHKLGRTDLKGVKSLFKGLVMWVIVLPSSCVMRAQSSLSLILSRPTWIVLCES